MLKYGVIESFLEIDNLSDAYSSRIERLTYCRNAGLKEIQKTYKNPIIYIPMDMDLDLFDLMSNSKLEDLIYFFMNQEKIDCLLPFSTPYYYDIFALRKKGWVNGNALIKPTASMLQWNVQYSPVDATQITYGLDVDLGLDGTPDLQPEYQETSYMIFAGVSSSAYTAPPAPPAGDTVPDQVGPFNIGVTTASGDAVVTFVLNGVSSNYS